MVKRETVNQTSTHRVQGNAVSLRLINCRETALLFPNFVWLTLPCLKARGFLVLRHTLKLSILAAVFKPGIRSKVLNQVESLTLADQRRLLEDLKKMIQLREEVAEDDEVISPEEIAEKKTG